MTRYIDADALISDFEYDVELDSRLLDDTGLVGLHREFTQFDKDCKANTIAYLKEAPTVDAVPVIRCMDCKFSSPNQAYGCKIHSFADDLDKRMYAYDFCSMAERKEE